jgi:hypothetical protein
MCIKTAARFMGTENAIYTEFYEIISVDVIMH